jgi:hypothetical protein
MTHEVRLTGLVGSHPLGALAAFGLLRCCQELDGFRGARLSWCQEADWFAVLECGETGDLVKALVQRQQRRPTGHEWNWADTLRTPRDRYLDAVAAARSDLEVGDRHYADFLVAFACDVPVGDGKDVQPTAFYMTSGQQEFLKEARKLAKYLVNVAIFGRQRKTAAEMFKEALFGPWQYKDPIHSLGLDPSTERLHALQAKRPKTPDNRGVAAVVWLALEALPLFPCFVSGGRLATTGFHTHGVKRDRVTSLTWPLWRRPLSLDTARSLLTLPELAQEQPSARELRARGVEVAFRSERYKVKTKGAYYILRPAYPCLTASG